MTDIIELFWDANPALRTLGVKVGAGTLDPRAETLFREVKTKAASAFPGAVTLVRIEVRRDSKTDLRVIRNGDEEMPPPGLRALIDRAVADLAAEAAEAARIRE